jgi:hypothetical protein
LNKQPVYFSDNQGQGDEHWLILLCFEDMVQRTYYKSFTIGC